MINIYKVVDGVFKGLNIVVDVFVVKYKKGLLFFRIVTLEGPFPNRSVLKSLDI
ncbi:hypothetical protein N7488_008913 [Penicillium malachiteum]|nr:hypothetical protein N7488_008913 [Penicillium malachiteum]